MIKVIDNKKIEVTDDEWSMYDKIVKSYTTATNKGEDLFIDLFETDNQGIIMFLKPPAKRQTSFEVFLFLMSLMQHQHLRLMYNQVDDICNQLKDKMASIDVLIKDKLITVDAALITIDGALKDKLIEVDTSFKDKLLSFDNKLKEISENKDDILNYNKLHKDLISNITLNNETCDQFKDKICEFNEKISDFDKRVIAIDNSVKVMAKSKSDILDHWELHKNLNLDIDLLKKKLEDK